MNARTNSTFIFVIVSLWLVGCDGSFHLVPRPAEVGQQATSSDSELVIEKPGLVVGVKGGQLQAPFTKNVKAIGTNVYVSIQTDSACEWHATTATLLSASKSIRSLSPAVSYHEQGSQKWRKVDSKEFARWPDSSRSILKLKQGTYCACFYFSARGDTLEYLHFPVILHLGSIIRGADTLSLDSLVFDAKVGRPVQKD
jgi:hypothetical protein